MCFEWVCKTNVPISYRLQRTIFWEDWALLDPRSKKLKKKGVQKWVSMGAASVLTGVECWEWGREKEGGGNF